MTESKDLDRTGFLGEIKRVVRASTTMGGIATRVIGNRLGVKTSQALHANELRLALGGLKGPLMKGAQILSNIPGALPEEYASQLAELQANAPPMAWSFVRRRMRAELGVNWERHFRSFSHHAAAAASLGQVHRAITADGQEVACKLQYPDMNSAVDVDLRQFRVVVALAQKFMPAIKQDDVVRELEVRLREELDYEREASHMRLYRAMLSEIPEVTVPLPLEALSTRRLLTMEWVTGRGIQKFLEANPTQEERNAIASALFKAWYTPVYRYGIIHGDPHMGNMTIRKDGGLNLLDFGAMRIFSPRFVKGIIDLFEALRDNNEDRAFAAYEAWGFTGISRETASVLNEWARFIYGPLMDDREREIQESVDPHYGREVAERVYAGLKRTGGVRPSREFVLVERSAIGLGSVFLRLKARLNWHRLFQDLIADFDEDALALRQREALRASQVPPPFDHTP